jgi:hypothetical protein
MTGDAETEWSSPYIRGALSPPLSATREARSPCRASSFCGAAGLAGCRRAGSLFGAAIAAGVMLFGGSLLSTDASEQSIQIGPGGVRIEDRDDWWDRDRWERRDRCRTESAAEPLGVNGSRHEGSSAGGKLPTEKLGPAARAAGLRWYDDADRPALSLWEAVNYAAPSCHRYAALAREKRRAINRREESPFWERSRLWPSGY